MMICSIHCRAHQVNSTRIYSDVVLISILLMDCFCHKAAIRSHHKAAKLCVDCNISHSCRNKYFFINLADTLSDHTDIIRFLIRCVRNSNTTRKINKLNMYSCFFLKTYCLFKKNFCKHWIIIICHCIAGKECMNTEFFCAFCLQCLKCFCDLLCCHSIL